MKKLLYIISIVCIGIGIFFYTWQQSLIVISFQGTTSHVATNDNVASQQKNITLWLYKQNQWVSESAQVIYTNDVCHNVQQLLNAWFLFAEEEQLIQNQITVQSVISTPSEQEVFVSCNQNPLPHQASTYDTLMLIEGMLKTLRCNNISLHMIRLLVNHQPLDDDRLNFHISWPISGYMQVS